MSSARLGALGAARGRIDGEPAAAMPQNDVRCARFERELHRLAHGELGEQRGGLERAAEPERGRAGARACRLTSRPSSSTVPVDRHEAADRVQQRRLARAVGADEPDDLAGHRRGSRRRRPRRARRSCTVRSSVAQHAAVGVQRRRLAAARRVQRRGRRGRRLRRRRRAHALLDPAQERVAQRSSRSARSRPGM